MNPPDTKPAALETAFLAIRRMDARLADLFLAALGAEVQECVDAMMVADTPFVLQQAQGAAGMARTFHERLTHAETRLARAAALAAKHQKGTPL
jgi:hypothetical protein